VDFFRVWAWSSRVPALLAPNQKGPTPANPSDSKSFTLKPVLGTD
jgi:hypothetical protein